MDDEKTITLKQPITLKGDSVTYSQLTLREPNVDELDRSAQVQGTVYAANALLIATVAGVPLPVVRQMKKTDYEEATSFLSGFTWVPPQSGKTSEGGEPTSPTSFGGDQTT